MSFQATASAGSRSAGEAAILDAAVRLFSRHGYDGVSMRSVAREAGVSKSNIYHHFESKEALYLANIAEHVVLVHRRDALRAEKVLQDRLFAREKEGKVSIEWHHVLDEVLGDDSGVTGLRVKNVKDGSTKDLQADGVFIAIGHKPNTALL